MKRFRRSTAGAAGLAMLMLLPAAGFAASEHHEPGAKAAVQNGPEEVRLAHMGGGMPGWPGMMAPGQDYGPGPCQSYGTGYGMGPGAMGPGMMGSGMMGQGVGPGMMGPGTMGPGMMGPGMMGPGMMGQGYGMGPGTMAPGQGYGPGPGLMGQGMGPGMMSPGTPGQGMMPPGQGYGPGPGMMAPGYGYGPQPGYGMGPGAAPDQGLSVDDVRARFERSLAWQGNPRLAVGDVTETDEDTITAEIVTRDGSLVQRLIVDRQSGAMRMAE
jgi:pre-mRNA-processing factor 40